MSKSQRKGVELASTGKIAAKLLGSEKEVDSDRRGGILVLCFDGIAEEEFKSEETLWSSETERGGGKRTSRNSSLLTGENSFLDELLGLGSLLDLRFEGILRVREVGEASEMVVGEGETDRWEGEEERGKLTSS